MSISYYDDEARRMADMITVDEGVVEVNCRPSGYYDNASLVIVPYINTEILCRCGHGNKERDPPPAEVAERIKTLLGPDKSTWGESLKTMKHVRVDKAVSLADPELCFYYLLVVGEFPLGVRGLGCAGTDPIWIYGDDPVNNYYTWDCLTGSGEMAKSVKDTCRILFVEEEIKENVIQE